jgi:hypothetical protein
VICKTCSKTTWSGCGMHVDSVRSMVPADQWCSGHPKTEKSRRLFGWARGKDES